MKNWLLWLSLVSLWGVSFAAIRIGVAHTTPVMLVVMRMILASLVLVAAMRWRGLRLPKEPARWGSFVFVGIWGNVLPFSLIGYGERYVESSLASLLMGMVPVSTVLLSPLVLADERWSARAFVGLAAGMGGLLVLVGTSALAGLGDHVVGQMMIIAAALCYATNTIYVRRFVTTPPLVMTTGTMLVGTVAIILVALLFEETPLRMDSLNTSALLAAAYLGIFATALATLIYFYLVPRLGASRLSQVNFLVPVCGSFVGVMFLGEPFELSALLALMLIMLAIYLISSRRRV